jgi:transposase
MKKPTRQELEKLSKDELIDLVLSLFDKIEIFEKKILDLQSRIEKLEGQIKPLKNSMNSSVPSSVDLTRPCKRTYQKGIYGPPKGHAGNSRKMVENPDYIIKIPIKRNPRTGVEIESNSNSFQTHQIIELEPLKVIVIEIQKQITTGDDGKTLIAPNPDGITDYQRFGPNLKKHVGYMRFSLNVPWSGILKWLKDMVGETISVGTIQKIFIELKESLEQEYNDIKEEVSKSDIVGADETGIHLDGKKWWLHVFRTDSATLYTHSKSRGHDVGYGILGADFEGILLSDFYGSYNSKFYQNAKGFQKCLSSHGLRKIKYAMECEAGKETYAKRLYEVIMDALILKKYFIFNSEAFLNEVIEIERRLDELLADGLSFMVDENRKLQKLFKQHRRELLTFLYIEALPSENNGSERDIRDLVIARKISGSYKTEKGLDALTIVKSVLSTAKKRKQSVKDKFEVAFGSFNFKPG